jgi:hypothetical protein
MSLLKGFLRAITPPKRWFPKWLRGSSPLAWLARKLGIRKSVRDAINVLLRATLAELEQRFEALLVGAGKQYAGHLAALTIKLLQDERIDWGSEAEVAQGTIDRVAAELRTEFAAAVPGVSAEVRAMLVAEAIRILLGDKEKEG